MSAKTWENKPQSVMNSLVAPSPATMEFSDAFYDSNNTSIIKYCPNGMKCNSFNNKKMPACPFTHVTNPDEMIAEEKKKYEKMHEKMHEKPPAINTSSPISFVDTAYSVEVVPNVIGNSIIMPTIPNAIYGNATLNNNGTITYSIIYNAAPASVTVSAPAIAPVTAATVVASTVKSNNFNMNASFGATKNIISSVASTNDASNLTKLHAQEKLDKKNEDNEGFETVQPKKNSKLVKTDDAVVRASPIPKTSARTSPIPKMTTFKKPCRFNDRCNKKYCTFEHPNGYVPGTISSDMCSYHIGINKKTGMPNQCYKLNCTFKHPDGYVPKPNVRCLGGDECAKEKNETGSCYFSHPWDEYWNDLSPNTRKH
jgi:hypothetical protein